MSEPGMIENGVLVGRDGYLFLAGGAHSVSDFVTGKREVHEVYYDIFRKNLRCRAAWARQNGAQFIHVIMPDKQSVIPEDWTLSPPIKLGAGYVERNPDFAPHLVYPVDLLHACRGEALSRVDTHLTDFGSILVAKHLVEKFSGVVQDAFFRDLIALIDGQVTSAGDLGSKLTPPLVDTYKMMSTEPPGVFFENHIEGANNGGVDLRFNSNAVYDKRVAVFGDSFGRGIARMLQFWYSEVYFFRTGFFHEEIVDLCKPDIVVTENVERYLDHCLSDDDRPHFLLFPYMNEKPYSPSIKFTTALSAVLNYPRKPYADFIAHLNIGGMPTGRAEPVQAGLVQRYDFANMADPPEADGVIAVLEEPRLIPRNGPKFVADFSGRGLELKPPPLQDLHGSYLVRRENVLLFGPNNVISQEGYWSCEARAHKRQFLWYMHEAFYDAMWPGPRPVVDYQGAELSLRTSNLGAQDVEMIDTPIFLATPLEPPIWGRWIATVASKVAQYKQHGAGRKFFCYTADDWQKAFLKLLGVEAHMILNHDPGRTYICRDLMTVEYSVTNMTISDLERTNFFEMVAKHQVKIDKKPKVFVSRLSRSKNSPNYRVLQNEEALAEMLAELGFITIEPETLPFEEQISVFGNAEQVVFLGGSGVYNAVFCAPGTSVVTIESSDTFIGPHTELLASLDLRYGVIFGAEDPSDHAQWHKRWTIDVARTRAALVAFFDGA
jgi:hypothetical protein